MYTTRRVVHRGDAALAHRTAHRTLPQLAQTIFAHRARAAWQHDGRSSLKAHRALVCCILRQTVCNPPQRRRCALPRNIVTHRGRRDQARDLPENARSLFPRILSMLGAYKGPECITDATPHQLVFLQLVLTRLLGAGFVARQLPLVACAVYLYHTLYFLRWDCERRNRGTKTLHVRLSSEATSARRFSLPRTKNQKRHIVYF